MKKHVFFTQTPLGAAIPAVKHTLSVMMNNGVDIDAINSVTISQNDIDTVKVYNGHDISINVARYLWQKDFLLDVIVKSEDIENPSPDDDVICVVDKATDEDTDNSVDLVINKGDETVSLITDETANSININDEDKYAGRTEDEILYFETFGEWPEDDNNDNNFAEPIQIEGDNPKNMSDEIIIVVDDTDVTPNPIPAVETVVNNDAKPVPVMETTKHVDEKTKKVISFDMSAFVPIAQSMADFTPTAENIIKGEKIRRATNVRGNVENIDRETLVDMIFEWEFNHSTNQFYNCVTEDDIRNIATKYVTGKYNFIARDGKCYNVPNESDMEKIAIVMAFIKDNIVSDYKPGVYLLGSYDMLKVYDSVTYFCNGENTKGQSETYVYNITINGIVRVKKDPDGNIHQKNACDANGVKDFCHRIDGYRSIRNYRFLLDRNASVLKA